MSTIRVIVIAFILISALVAWWKAGFKCPLYIHVIAGFATALGFFIADNTDPNTPMNQWWLLGQYWIVLVMPAFVYGGFAVYGSGIYSNPDGRFDSQSKNDLPATQTLESQSNPMQKSRNASKSDPAKKLAAAY